MNIANFCKQKLHLFYHVHNRFFLKDSEGKMQNEKRSGVNALLVSRRCLPRGDIKAVSTKLHAVGRCLGFLRGLPISTPRTNALLTPFQPSKMDTRLTIRRETACRRISASLLLVLKIQIFCFIVYFYA